MFRQYILTIEGSDSKPEIYEGHLGKYVCQRAEALAEAGSLVYVTDTEHLDQMVYAPGCEPFLMAVA